MAERMILAVLVSLLLLCGGIGMVVVTYLWLVWYVSIHQRAAQRPLVDNGKPPKQQGLSEADLQRLPTIECREGEERTPGGEEGECAVCLDLFQIGDRCRVIPACSHAFHVQCADAWLSKRPVCPICRRSAAVVLQGAEERDEESGRCCPLATAESVVVDISIAIAPTEQRGTGATMGY